MKLYFQIWVVVFFQLLATTTIAKTTNQASQQSERVLKASQECKINKTPSGKNFSIVILDAGGEILFANRSFETPPLIMKIALAKARSSHDFRIPTSEIGSIRTLNNGLQSLTGAISIPGGVPIFDAKTKIYRGSIGVSGGTPADDEECAAIIKKTVESMP